MKDLLKKRGNLLMKKEIFIILLFLAPLLFFFWYRSLQIIVGNDNQEPVKYEIIGALMCGFGVSLGLWNLKLWL